MLGKELEIYIHIPFCIRKCKYCDFLSGPADKETKDAYMEALCRELKEKSDAYKEYQVTTVFIGGGTPTAVSAKWICKVMKLLKEYFTVQDTAEITMEMNPGTVDGEALRLYKEAGINRLSMGLQSASDKELELLGRIHTYEQFAEGYNFAREAGFTNINVDIMSALPEQTLESYQKTLEKVTSLVPPPEHISAYSLIIEEGTPFFEAYEKNLLRLPDEEAERAMYEMTRSFLQKQGYERYEISNYAKPGRECRHNLGYWERKDYLGFGIGAASLIGNERFQNGRDMKQYIKAPCNVVEEKQSLSKAEQMEETMFLGLRKVDGVSVDGFEKSFGISLMKIYGTVVEKHRNEGLLEFRSEGNEKCLCLTLKGMDVCNYVMADFLEPCLLED